MIKLIASDLDGTLLQNGAQSLDPSIFPVIRKLHEKGILFVAASGRQYFNLRNLFSEVKDDISYICENGALYVHKDKLHIPHMIAPATVNRIIEEVHQRQDCDLTISCEDHMYIEARSQAFYHHMHDVIGNDIVRTDDLLTITRPAMKMAIFNAQGIAPIADHYKQQFGSEVTVVTSGNDWVDFIPKAVHKGAALEKIMEEMSITSEECMAFGDQWNDIEMLKLAGTSFAMANAVPGISDYCTNRTDSVIRELEKLL